MKGKVTCTCGWSWNKSDSSKKDMYICHECGRDNSNNIPKAQNGVSSKDVPTPLIPYSNEYIDSLENNYLNLYNNPSTRMDDGYDAFFHSMIDGLPDVTRKAKGWVEYKPGTDIEEFTEDDGTNSAPTPGKNKMVKRVEDYEISDRPDVAEQVRLAHYMQERAINKLDSRTVSNKEYPTNISKQKNGGWLDNYGEEANANDGYSSAPDNWRGDGYSNVGRNYSPAWGGQFQMGGSVYPVNYVPQAAMGASMPGSVGFTYARTKGIPSEGPYAKKTMPSAQNGQEMRYYQNGLDFKTKGMRDGGWLDGYEKAQWGKNLTPKQLELKKQVERNNRKIETQNKYNEYQENKRKAADLENKKAQAKSYVQANMEKAYDHPLMSPGYFTPEGAVIGALQGATKMGPDLYEGNYSGAALDALIMLPEVANIVKKLIPIKTPAGFQNKVFDSNVQLGKYEGVGHLSEPGYNYRVLSPKEIKAIQESNGVFPRLGKQKGGNTNVKYWTKGNKKNWYGDKADLETIRVNEINFNPDKVVNSKHVELYNKQTGKFNPLKQGGIIKDDRGQWDHPGEVTRIKGGNITMKKDPKTGKALTEPLLGIADTGEQQWMYPGKDYTFEGANYVTEIPKRKLAKNGLRQEQKGLVNLDDLTNFTNYNKSQPSGWLSKYE